MSCPVIAIDASRANRSQRTGVEWYAFHVIQELKRIIPAEYCVVLYSEEPLRDGLEELPPNWESRVLRWPPRVLWTQVRLSWELLTHRPSVLFVPAYVPPLVALLLGGRAVTTLHDPAFVTFPEAYSRHGALFLKALYRVAVAAGPVLTVSEFSKSELVSACRADPERVTVTPLGYDAARYVPSHDVDALHEVLRRHGIGERSYFLFVGRLETKKNVRGLLTAFARYKQARPDDSTLLVLVGKDGHGAAAEWAAFDAELSTYEPAQAARIRGAVVRPGYVPQGDMPLLYAGATAFTFPSRYEGFGIPLLEAFAVGTPVITSNVTSMPEVAGNAALLVNPEEPAEIAEAMVRMADDHALRADLRAKGLARAAAYSWRKTAEATWHVVCSAMEI